LLSALAKPRACDQCALIEFSKEIFTYIDSCWALLGAKILLGSLIDAISKLVNVLVRWANSRDDGFAIF